MVIYLYKFIQLGVFDEHGEQIEFERVRKALAHLLGYERNNYELKKIVVLHNAVLEKKFSSAYNDFSQRALTEPQWKSGNDQKTKDLQWKCVSHVCTVFTI